MANAQPLGPNRSFLLEHSRNYLHDPVVALYQVRYKLDIVPLSQELKAFVEGAEDGVILFCLGISTEMTAMIEKELQPLFTVFGELRQRVIAKGHYFFIISLNKAMFNTSLTTQNLNLHVSIPVC